MDAKSTSIAIIGGTGLNEFQSGEIVGSRSTPFGDASSCAVVSTVADKPIVFLARHGSPHAIAPHKINYRANLWLLKQMGVESILAVNAVGSIRSDLTSGSIVIPSQLVDYTSGRDHTYYDGSFSELLGSELEHCDFTYPFNEQLRSFLIQGAQNEQLPVATDAVYAVTQGPRLETPAEINRYEKDGCDIVGMTAMPEAALACELGIKYASVCLVVNPAAGRSQGIITMDDIRAVINDTMISVRQLLNATVQLM